MEKFVVSIWETLRKDVVVEADNLQSAQDKVLHAYKDGKITIGMDDFVADFTDSDVEPLADAIALGDVIESELVYLD